MKNSTNTKVPATQTFGRVLRTGGLATAATLALALSAPVTAGHGANAHASANVGAHGNAAVDKQIYTGVVTGIDSVNTAAGNEVLVKVLSGSGRQFMVNVGELSKARRNRLMLDTRMDVFGSVDSNGVVVAERANANGKALVGQGIGAKEIERHVGKGEKNFTGLVSGVARSGSETTFSLTSGVGKTVQATVDNSMVPSRESGLLEKGSRASISGEVESGNRINAKRVVVAGGAAARGGMTAMKDKMAGGKMAGEEMARGAMADRMTAEAPKKNYSGVLTGTETIMVDGKPHVVAIMKSGSGRVVTADLGSLSASQSNQLKVGSRMDIVGHVDRNNMVEPDRVNLNGKAFISAK